MASLRDRLRAIEPAKPIQPQREKRSDTCFVRDTWFAAPPELDAITREAAETAGALSLPEGFCPEDILYLDTETTGLSGGAGTIAFMVGIGRHEQGGVRVTQYMMRDYDEESALLRPVYEAIQSARVLCTFNGKTFDMPILSSRMTLSRMRLHADDMPHIDLLHAARRVYKLRLGRCSLGALEHALGLTEREDDLPGSEAPTRFFELVRSGDMEPMEAVLRHNAQDVASLSVLLARLCAAYRAPEREAWAEDTLSIGRALEKQGHRERARMCYTCADRGATSAAARARLSESYRKERDWERAADILRRMIAAGQGGLSPSIALSKVYEHHLHDPARALDIARRALILSAEPALRPVQDITRDDLLRRVRRLETIIERRRINTPQKKGS